MKSTNREFFGETAQPASFSELINFISKPHPIWDDRVYMWRGQSDINWPVHSSAYRRLSQEKMQVTENDIIHYEKSLLEQATHRGYRLYEGRLLSDMELLARLQHHGAATRLVDFTRSALIALWYTCFSTANKNKTGVLIGFHSAFIGGYESEPEVREYAEVMKEAERIEHPITWEPTLVSKRIASQHSQFLYSTLSTDKTGSLMFPGDYKNSVMVLSVTPKVKAECVSVLEQLFDIRYHTLFPDIDGFSEANSHIMPEKYMFRW
ncbi:MAG: FRG domain-containing protein [Candidatus Thiodiazotropha taylori]